MNETSGNNLESFSFLLIVLDVSEKIILKWPGHESLWYHRRSLIEIILGTTRETFQRMQSINEVDEIQPLVTEISISLDTLFRVTSCSEISLVEDSSSEAVNVGVEYAAKSSSKVLERKKDLSDELEKLFKHIFDPSVVHDFDGHNDIFVLKFVYIFLLHEIVFVGEAVTKKYLWDSSTQNILARRYAAFVMSRVKIFFNIFLLIKSVSLLNLISIHF